MVPKRFPAAALALAALLPTLAATRPNPIPEVRHEDYTLSNGLRVVLAEDHAVPIVGVNVNYQVGSKNERPGRTGFAHLFEHMMFQGSKNYNDDFFKPLQPVGAFVNGATNTDRTRYLEVVPASYLERALWLESDRMGFLLDAMTQERLANQIAVVQNERRQNYENRPYGTVREKIAAVLYPEGHPYHWITIGSIEDLQAASLDDVKAFFKAYYTPNNATLCIAGDFDPAQAKRLVAKYFGALPPGPPVSRMGRWVPELPGEVVLALQDRVQLPRTSVVWNTPPIYDPDDAALDAFGRILGGGKTSRLYKRLVYDLQIAQDAVAGNSGQQIAGTFQMTLTPRPGHTPEEVERAAFQVLEETLRDGVTAEELDRTIGALTAQSVRSMQQVGGFGGLTDQMGAYVHYRGEPDLFRWDLQRFLDLSPEAVNAAARRWLGPRRLIARVAPLDKLSPDASGEAASVDRTRMPGPAAQRPFALPARQRFSLPNGLKVVLVEHHRLPLVEVQMVVRGGAAADPAGKPGLASLTAAMLDEGAGGRSSRQIADALEGLGTNLSLGAGADAVTAGLSSLKANLAPSLAILADVVLRPGFPAEELDRQRKSRLVSLTQSEDRPEFLAQVALARVLWGSAPYGHLPEGTKPGLEAITRDDLNSFWSSCAVPSNVTLIAVGDVTRAELEPELVKAFGGWRGGKAPPPPSPVPAQHGRRAVYLVDKPGAAQSIVGGGLVGPARSTPDYPALLAVNGALGGTFVSRVNMNLRENKGYTYGARTSFQLQRAGGSFVAQAPVATKVTAPALRELVAEISDFVGSRPLTDQELAYSADTFVNGYARGFETAGDIAAKLAEAAADDLPDGALESLPAEVKGVALEPARAAARKYLLPGNLAILVVGDKAAILPELQKLELGPIVELDKQGNPVK